VLCYDGTHDAGMTVCDRIPSNAVAPLDAGPTDVPGSADGAPVDAVATVDAHAEFDASADDEDAAPVAEQDVVAVGELDVLPVAKLDAGVD
jgi:hypothetical protein